MTRWLRFSRGVVRDEDAATMPEYALMIALIAVVCFGVVTALGVNARTTFNTIANVMLRAAI
jgi:pilus assembly protein Flp/PilA